MLYRADELVRIVTPSEIVFDCIGYANCLVQVVYCAEIFRVTYLSMRIPTLTPDSPGPWWIEGVWTSYLDLIVTSSQPQRPCLHNIALWVDTRKGCGSKSNTSAVCVAPLRKRKLLSTSSVSARPLIGAGINFLALSFLSAWRSYPLLTSRI